MNFKNEIRFKKLLRYKSKYLLLADNCKFAETLNDPY